MWTAIPAAAAGLLPAAIVFLQESDRFTRNRGQQMRSAQPRAGYFTSVATSQLNPELVLIFMVPILNRKPTFQLGLILLLVMAALIRANRPRTAVTETTRIPAIILLIVIALSYRDGPYMRAAVLVGVFVLLYIASSVIPRRSAYDSLLAGLVLYLVANILGWVVGMTPPMGRMRESLMATSSPFFRSRIAFPFSASVNEVPYIAAALFVAVIAMVSIRRRPLWYHWLGAFSAIFVLLAANNRSSIFIGTFVSLALLLGSRATRFLAPYVVGTTLLAPFVVGLANPFVKFIMVDLDLNSFIARGGSVNGPESFEGRQLIWSGITRFWSDGFPDHLPAITSLLFGYGSPGHVKSGAYLYVPRSGSTFLLDRTYLHAHNSMLQGLLDVGLIGAVLLWAVTVLVVYRYGRQADLLPIFAVAVVIAMSGVFEPLLNAGFHFVPVYALLYLAAFAPAAGRTSSPNLTARSYPL